MSSPLDKPSAELFPLLTARIVDRLAAERQEAQPDRAWMALAELCLADAPLSALRKAAYLAGVRW